MPLAAPSCPDATPIQCVGNRPVSRDAARLDLLDDRQYVGGEGISLRRTGGYTQALRLSQIGPIAEKTVVRSSMGRRPVSLTQL